MVLPDIFTVDESGEQQLILGETIFLNQRKGLFALRKIKTDSGKRHFYQLGIDVPHIPEVGLQ